MKYLGNYWWNGYKDPDGPVTHAILTQTKLSLDWIEQDDKGHLEATSSNNDDDDIFEGNYSYTRTPGVGRTLLRLHHSGTRLLLFGTWDWPPTEEDGTWVIVLEPVDVNPKK
jgi:hypothetical protein